MLRRELVRQRHGVSDAGHLNQPDVTFKNALDEFAARQLGQLFGNFFLNDLENFCGGRHEPDAFVAGTVLGLCEHVGGGELRIRRVVGDDKQIARASEQINRHAPDEQPLGHADVGVAGTKNFLHATDRLGAVSQRRNRLRAADAVNLRRPRRARREQNCRIDGAVPATRRGHHDFLAARDFGERDGHQRRGDERRGAAGNVDADACERVKLFTNTGAVGIFRLPVFTQRFFGEAGDIPLCFRHRGTQRLIRLERRGHEFCLRHSELIGG